jgi:hypothetical protein
MGDGHSRTRSTLLPLLLLPPPLLPLLLLW